jgi:hypothetical protein
MADSHHPPPSQEQSDPYGGDSDAAEVLRVRATATRRQRDAAIAQLRETMTDEETLDNFGIDLPEIEK